MNGIDGQIGKCPVALFGTVVHTATVASGERTNLKMQWGSDEGGSFLDDGDFCGRREFGNGRLGVDGG